MEDHDFVDAVEKLGTEVVLEFFPHGVLDLVLRLPGHPLNDGRTDIAGHDDDGVLEIHRAALAIGESPVVEHLQQHVEDVRVGFFHFVEQDHAVRLAADSLSQVAAFVVAHIAWRRANEPRHGMLFHEFAHIDAHHVFFGVEQERSQRLGQFRFADTCRA